MFEIDTISLRGYGICQEEVHPAIQALTMVEPFLLNFRSETRVNNDLQELFSRMPQASIAFKTPVESVTAGLFHSCTRVAHFKEGKLAAGSGYHLIICDHSDGEAVAVSRFLQEHFALVVGNWLEDQDILPVDYASLLKKSNPSHTVFMFSKRTTSCVTQLARLGLLVKNYPSANMIPLVVGVSFDFPDQEYLLKLETNKALSLGDSPGARLAQFAGDDVNLKQVAEGLTHVMSYLITFVNVSILTPAALDKSLKESLQRALAGGRRVSGGPGSAAK
jgi:hypothetical protein